MLTRESRTWYFCFWHFKISCYRCFINAYYTWVTNLFPEKQINHTCRSNIRSKKFSSVKQTHYWKLTTVFRGVKFFRIVHSIVAMKPIKIFSIIDFLCISALDALTWNIFKQIPICEFIQSLWYIFIKSIILVK